MIQLSGKTFRDPDDPDGEIEIEFTGLRPGEKLYEELHLVDEVMPTTHPKIMAANENHLPLTAMDKHIADFAKHVSAGNEDKAISLLSELVEGFEPQIENRKQK